MSFEVVLETPVADGEWEMAELLAYNNANVAEWFGVIGENGAFELEDPPGDASEDSLTQVQFRSQEQVVVIEDPSEMNSFWEEEWSDVEIGILSEILQFLVDAPKGSRLLVFEATPLRQLLNKAVFNPIGFARLIDFDSDQDPEDEDREDDEGEDDEVREDRENDSEDD